MKLCYVTFSLIVLLFSGLSSPVFAQQIESCALFDENTVVIFSNGMFNDRKRDVWFSMMRVSRMVRSFPSDPRTGLTSEDTARFLYTYVYNKNELFPFQILEIAVQRTSEEISAFLGWVRGLIPKPEFVENALDIIPFLRDKVQQITDADLRRHISVYKKYLTEGRRVIVVAHSQGNIYANRAYNEIKRQLPDLISSMHIIGVGTPVKSDNGPYVTLREDLIISKILRDFTSTPRDNAHNTNETGDFSGHNFIKSYMKGNDSGKKIKDLLVAAIKNIPFPDPLGSQGIITVALSWDEQPDVDLHVIEPAPNSVHVYYANRIGIAGFLDIDTIKDFNGNLPEHYVVDCETIKPGIYVIGGNYFRGTGPTDTIFNISAGRERANIDHKFTTPLGFFGDNNFTEIARIIVRQAIGSEKFFFDIQQ